MTVGCRTHPILASLLVASAFAVSPALGDDHISFKGDVTPILEMRCASCHQPGGEGYRASGLDLTSHEGLMKGTRFGAVVVPGSAYTSNLMVLVEGRAAEAIRMPFHHKGLTQCEIAILRRWINQGAKNN